ncbi:hypothetical protein C7E12_22945, partial [Stenotrophomonas maltophilia]
GLPIAFAAYFWGNRLLPLQIAERSSAEANVFFYAWGGALLACRSPSRRTSGATACCRCRSPSAPVPRPTCSST